MDIDESMLLKQAIERIKDGIKKYNESHDRPYNISVSMGYSVYDIKSGMKAEEFLKHIDNLMFNDKKKNSLKRDLVMNQSEHKKDAGKSSFSRVDTEKLFQIIDLKPEDNFLDVGCGRGEYTLTAAKYLGAKSTLFAIDLWEDGVEILREEAKKADINNLQAYVGDISQGLPIKDEMIDKCLMSAVLHGIKENGKLEMTIQEIRRVLQTDGELIIIEWKKVEGPPGPGIMVRFMPEEIETLLKPFGFEQKTVQDVGEYFYVSIFVKVC
jgi:ubiquinone/menaquinone biosynthesis C-methylase UbiE